MRPEGMFVRRSPNRSTRICCMKGAGGNPPRCVALEGGS